MVPRLLCWLAIVPTVVFLCLEANVRSVINGRLRVYNAVDLLIMTIFYHLLFQALCEAVFLTRGSEEMLSIRRCRGIAALLITIFQVGRSVHIAADAIHTYATEIHEYKNRVPTDMLELIYFLDEDLGHWLLFIPYYSLLALLTSCYRPEGEKKTTTMPVSLLVATPRTAQRSHDVPPWSTRTRVQIILAGLLMGATHAVAVIESSHWWLGIYGALVLLSVVILAATKAALHVDFEVCACNYSCVVHGLNWQSVVWCARVCV